MFCLLLLQVLKPSSSRIRSAEHFIVGKGYRWSPGELNLDTGSAAPNAGTAESAASTAKSEAVKAMLALRAAMAIGDLSGATPC